MKKLILATALAAFGAANATAQETTVPVKKYSVATNSFWANWFISAGVNYNAAYSSQEASDMSFNPFSSKRGNLGATFAIGKWFTPSIGLRTKAQAWRTKGVYSDNVRESYSYFNIHEDVMFNLSNMLCGYNETRVWNFIPYVGLGYYRNMTHNNDDISYNVGLYNTFRLSNRLKAFIDIYAMAVEGTADAAKVDPWNKYEKGSLRHWDKQLGAEIGLSLDISKTNTWSKVPDVDALMAMNKEQMDALNASLKDQQDENARLKAMLANQKPAETKTITKTELVTTSASVFFNLNSSKIASRKDLVNVKEIAEYAKANGKTIVVNGYADSKTGNAEINNKLAQARANAVADELVKMGVSRSNIEVNGKGGVDTLSPFSYNRRATVTLK